MFSAQSPSPDYRTQRIHRFLTPNCRQETSESNSFNDNSKSVSLLGPRRQLWGIASREIRTLEEGVCKQYRQLSTVSFGDPEPYFLMGTTHCLKVLHFKHTVCFPVLPCFPEALQPRLIRSCVSGSGEGFLCLSCPRYACEFTAPITPHMTLCSIQV